MARIFLSPSTQQYNQYYDGSGSEEYYMNLIADAMEPYLRENGIEFSRNDKNAPLSSAISASNAGNYDLHLALHSNAAPDRLSGMLRGTDFYYFTKSTRGKDAATVLADNFMNIYPSPSLVKTMPTTVLAEVTKTKAPAVLAELAYHDNEQDAEWIKANIDTIAKNLVIGLCEFFGIQFVSDGTDTPDTELDDIPEAELGIVTTEADPLNIRKGPATSYEVIDQAPKGARLRVYCEKDGWYIVDHKGTLGFVSSKYVTLRSLE